MVVRMLIRRETTADIATIRSVTRAAFARTGQDGATQPEELGQPEGAEGPEEPVEPRLVDWLRADRAAWLPAFSLVAVAPEEGGGGRVIGHVLGTRGHVDGTPAIGLGPLSVAPAEQRRGVGSALVHALLGAAEALDEPLVALLGDPGYYRRFGFELGTDRGIQPPVPEWGPHFQVRTLTAYDPAVRGTFRYPEPFDRL
jgi:putative acetyltransferase